MATAVPRADRTIDNPVIGDRVTFLKTAQETSGEFLLTQIELAPHGGTAKHYHVAFTETFEVLEGELHVSVDGQEHVLRAGDKAFVPMRAAHHFYSTSDEPVVFRLETRPARTMEQATRIAYGLARDGKTNAKAVPRNIWELALVFDLGESYLVGMPLVLQQVIFGILARIARWRGVDKRLEKYL